MKTDFTTLDGQEVLAKLAAIPVMSWRYKTDDETDRHFGPVAEDFQAAFQLGDGKTIANIDADGVALAAIKGLDAIVKEELNRKDEEIAVLRRNLAALEQRLAALEAGSR
jgi:ubiquinone biosynthesis protein UbiJ